MSCAMAAPSVFSGRVLPQSVIVPVAAPIVLATPLGAVAGLSVAQVPVMHRLPMAQLPASDPCRRSKDAPVVSLQQALVHRIECDATALEQNRTTSIAKNALKLSQDRGGCRLVQQALEAADSDEARLALVETLRGHIWEVTTCPHANHVLQKYIVTMKPTACQFVVDELTRQGAMGACRLARHKYGYRVFQRLLEHLMPQQTAQLVEGIMLDCVSLSMHRFGTYVMQHVLEYGTDAQRERVIAALMSQIPKVSMNNDACMVLDAALVRGDDKSQDLLTQAILDSDGAIGAMAHTRRGHVVVLSLLELVGGELLEKARRQIMNQASSLKRNRFGRLVLNFLQLHCGGVIAAVSGGA